ncbi:MAG: Thymidylate kinase [Chrysothrix sp. TS-e1954]|nr:MAG: Thymidylate kinase [Chrysothrix sp. TS-e1954]
MRGTLIVFEGLDRAGKSTQCNQLVEHLKGCGHSVRKLRFPDRTTVIGQMIDNYLKGQIDQEDHVIHLLFSANRWELATQIETDIRAGTTIIVDRYYYSGSVYSAAKDNPTLSLEWARRADEGLPRPDVCIFLDISSQEGAKRGGFGAEKYENPEMQDRVRRLFSHLRASPDGSDIIAIDGGESLDDVQRRVQAIAKQTMEAVASSSSPLRHAEPW